MQLTMPSLWHIQYPLLLMVRASALPPQANLRKERQGLSTTAEREGMLYNASPPLVPMHSLPLRIEGCCTMGMSLGRATLMPERAAGSRRSAAGSPMLWYLTPEEPSRTVWTCMKFL